jgi:hypothetical protein
MPNNAGKLNGPYTAVSTTAANTVLAGARRGWLKKQITMKSVSISPESATLGSRS